MRILTKKVYYCEYCKKHGLSRHAMEKHERHCTLNPGRTCRWSLLDYESTKTRGLYGPHQHTMRKGLPRWLRLRRPLKKDDIDTLREHCLGCPACMLAAVRQARLDFMQDWDYSYRWDYEEEIARYREDERFYWEQEERREIEASFL